MNKFKIVVSIFFMLGVLSAPSQARAGIPTTCVNCSNFIQQILDSVTMGNELATQIQQYKEMISQTTNQIWMIEQETRRLLTLPQQELSQFTDQFTQLANAYRNLGMYAGDMSAMSDIFRQLYPDLNHYYGLTENSDPNAVQQEWKERQKVVDEAAGKVFALSADEMKRLTSNPQQMKSHIDSLLAQKNETQIAQSANKLSSLILKELNDLNIMTATNMQYATHITQNEQKQKEIDRGNWDRATTVDNQQFKYEGKIRF